MDQKIVALTTQNSTLEAQKMGVEKAFELSKIQLGDKIRSY